MIKTFRKEEESQVVGSSSDIGKLVIQVELDEVVSQLKKEPYICD